MKIVAFGASNSKKSINKEFAKFAANQFKSTSVEVLDLNDYPLPIYSIDLENEDGLPDNAILFHEKLKASDMIIISFAEHNGSYAVVFKNLFDWVSRVELKMFEGKKLFLLSTAPGPRGGLGVLEHAVDRFPRHGAVISAVYTLPQYNQHFSAEEGILDDELREKFLEKVRMIEQL